METTILEKQKELNLQLINSCLKNNDNNFHQIKFLKGTKVKLDSISDVVDIEPISIYIKHDSDKLMLKFECHEVRFCDTDVPLEDMFLNDINKIIKLIDTNSINYYYIETNQNEDCEYKMFNSIKQAQEYFSQKVTDYTQKNVLVLLKENGQIIFKDNLSCTMKIKNEFLKMEIREF